MKQIGLIYQYYEITPRDIDIADKEIRIRARQCSGTFEKGGKYADANSSVKLLL